MTRTPLIRYMAESTQRLKIDVCPLCGGKRFVRTMTCADFSVSKEEFDLNRCEECNFVFTQEAPIEKSMGAYYNSPEYVSHTDTSEGVVNKLYHVVRKHMLKKKTRLVLKETHLKKGTLLDVGSGTGYFADAMQMKGWFVDAIEKDDKARQYSQEKFQLNVLDDSGLYRLKPGTYDVITMWHVMEHMESLDKVWEQLYRLLNERGKLIIAVPNNTSYDAEIYKEKWAAYDVPRHLWHFNPLTIQRMGLKHNFILAAHYPMPFDAFYISIMSEKNCGSSFAFLKGMYTGVKAWMHSLGKKDRSSSIIYVFRKKHD